MAEKEDSVRAEKTPAGRAAVQAEKAGTESPVREEKAGAEEAKADAGVRHEKSCGAVVICTEGGARRYVLTCSLKGVWGFPKGHMEGQETEHRTARREIREETGLNVSFIKGFRRTDEYMILRKDSPAIDKQVVYFLARYERQTPVPQETEVSRIELFDYEGAMKRLTFDSSRRILAAAQRFLDRREDRNREK
ncbi:MAG: NUDIX domain-containing protein [Lachnospiraceae bacterium]|nr:NUDIX domain-containing protein [Lachnospiraceae bacterium]